MNTYGYVGGNPLTFFDFHGLYRGTTPNSGSSRDIRADKEYRRRVAEITKGIHDLYVEYGGCFGFACVEARADTHMNEVLITAMPEIGGGLSFCMEDTRQQDPMSCSIADEVGSFQTDEVSFGMGRKLGITFSPDKFCINIGLGVGSPIAPADSLGEKPFY